MESSLTVYLEKASKIIMIMVFYPFFMTNYDYDNLFEILWKSCYKNKNVWSKFNIYYSSKKEQTKTKELEIA